MNCCFCYLSLDPRCSEFANVISFLKLTSVDIHKCLLLLGWDAAWKTYLSHHLPLQAGLLPWMIYYPLHWLAWYTDLHVSGEPTASLITPLAYSMLSTFRLSSRAWFRTCKELSSCRAFANWQVHQSIVFKCLENTLKLRWLLDLWQLTAPQLTNMLWTFNS